MWEVNIALWDLSRINLPLSCWKQSNVCHWKGFRSVAVGSSYLQEFCLVVLVANQQCPESTSDCFRYHRLDFASTSLCSRPVLSWCFARASFICSVAS